MRRLADKQGDQPRVRSEKTSHGAGHEAKLAERNPRTSTTDRHTAALIHDERLGADAQARLGHDAA